MQVEHEGQKIEMRLWDTAGQEDYERLRILAYEGVDVVVMCFSLVNKNSFDNILVKWLPEYRQHLSGIPVREHSSITSAGLGQKNIPQQNC